MIALTYPNWRLMRSVWEQPRLPLWNPGRNMGEPHLADPQTMAAYPLMWALSGGADFRNFLRRWIVLHGMLAAVFMGLLAYRWYRCLPAAAAAAALAGLNGFFTARLTFTNHFAAAAWLPAVLYFQSAGSSVGLGVSLALQWLAGFPPFFCLSLLAALGLAVAGGRPGIKRFLQGCAWGAGLAAVQALPFLELMSRSVRGFFLSAEAATQFSIPPGQLLRELFVPQWHVLRPALRGDPAIVSFYVGLVAICLALWGIGRGRREVKIAVAVAAACVLSLGGYLPGYGLLPLIRLFRFPANWLLLASAGLAMLCAAGISRLTQESWRWALAGVLLFDLLLFAQPPHVAWFEPGFLTDSPAMLSRFASVKGPVRIYHQDRLFREWKKGFLEKNEDYLLMRDYLAPSYGTSFGLQEVLSYQNLTFRPAAAFQRRLAAAGPASPLLDLVGASLVIGLAADAERVEYRRMRIAGNANPRPRVFLRGEGGGAVELLDYRPGRVRVRARSPVPAELVFTEADYPGWYALLDGKPAVLERFEGLFIKTRVPAGTHELVFRFCPWSFWIGLLISLATAAGVLRVLRSCAAGGGAGAAADARGLDDLNGHKSVLSA